MFLGSSNNCPILAVLGRPNNGPIFSNRVFRNSNNYPTILVSSSSIHIQGISTRVFGSSNNCPTVSSRSFAKFKELPNDFRLWSSKFKQLISQFGHESYEVQPTSQPNLSWVSRNKKNSPTTLDLRHGKFNQLPTFFSLGKFKQLRNTCGLGKIKQMPENFRLVKLKQLQIICVLRKFK